MLHTHTHTQTTNPPPAHILAARRKKGGESCGESKRQSGSDKPHARPPALSTFPSLSPPLHPRCCWVPRSFSDTTRRSGKRTHTRAKVVGTRPAHSRTPRHARGQRACHPHLHSTIKTWGLHFSLHSARQRWRRRNQHTRARAVVRARDRGRAHTPPSSLESNKGPRFNRRAARGSAGCGRISSRRPRSARTESWGSWTRRPGCRWPRSCRAWWALKIERRERGGGGVRARG